MVKMTSFFTKWLPPFNNFRIMKWQYITNRAVIVRQHTKPIVHFVIKVPKLVHVMYTSLHYEHFQILRHVNCTCVNHGWWCPKWPPCNLFNINNAVFCSTYRGGISSKCLATPEYCLLTCSL